MYGTWKIIAGRGREPSSHPNAVAPQSIGTDVPIHVADHGDQRVQKLSISKSQIAQCDRKGNGPGEFT